MSIHSKSINSKQITLAIGFLGALFPLVLPIGTYYFGNCKRVMPSISQYYYTIMADVFVGILFILAAFFFSYKGYDKWDNRISNIMAACCACIALFPAHISQSQFLPCNDTRATNNPFTGTVHNITAALFFLLLSYNSFFNFTKTDETQMGKIKKLKNTIFKGSAIVIFVCLVLMAWYSFTNNHSDWLKSWNPIYSLEFIALQAFAISWLTKSGYFVK